MQQPTRDDARPAASSGIFVFTSTPHRPFAVGDSVLVTGPVSEFYRGTLPEATTESISITEITPTVVTTISSGNVLPAPLVVGEDTVPGTYAPPSTGPGVQHRDDHPDQPRPLALEFWEAHEGMLVTVNDVRIVAPGQPQFGEIFVTTKPHELETPRGGTYIKSYARDADRAAADHADQRPGPGGERRRPAHRRHDRSGRLVDRSAGTPSRPPRSAPMSTTASRPPSATKQAADQLAVATYNVENLDPTDPPDQVRPAGARVS